MFDDICEGALTRRAEHRGAGWAGEKNEINDTLNEWYASVVTNMYHYFTVSICITRMRTYISTKLQV